MLAAAVPARHPDRLTAPIRDNHRVHTFDLAHSAQIIDGLPRPISLRLAAHLPDAALPTAAWPTPSDLAIAVS
jgi:hypothetical protein